MSETFQALNQIAEQLSALHDQIKAALERGYPIGSAVRWDHHGHRQIGTVQAHCVAYQGSAQLVVQNHRTGKVVRITYSPHDNGFYS